MLRYTPCRDPPREGTPREAFLDIPRVLVPPEHHFRYDRTSCRQRQPLRSGRAAPPTTGRTDPAGIDTRILKFGHLASKPATTLSCNVFGLRSTRPNCWPSWRRGLVRAKRKSRRRRPRMAMRGLMTSWPRWSRCFRRRHRKRFERCAKFGLSQAQFTRRFGFTLDCAAV
jgi:hypothetical protein